MRRSILLVTAVASVSLGSPVLAAPATDSLHCLSPDIANGRFECQMGPGAGLAGRVHVDANTGVVIVAANYLGQDNACSADLGTGGAGCAGMVGGSGIPALPRSPGESMRSNHRDVNGTCAFRVATTEGNDVLLTVRGVGTASGAPRPVATEIQCRIINEAGQVVFDLTRAESGAVAAQAGAVIIRNDGPYTVCSRAEAKFDDGEDIYWPSNNTAVMACFIP